MIKIRTPHIPLVPFKLLPGFRAQMEWVWEDESKYGFPERNCLGLQKVLPLTSFPLVFAAIICGDLSSWHWSPALGVLVWLWDSSLPRYPSQIFIHHSGVRDQPVLCLCSCYQSGWMWILWFRSCQTSIQLDFCWFWMMFVPYVSCNFDVVVWRRAMCAYVAILTGSPPPPSALKSESELLFGYC